MKNAIECYACVCVKEFPAQAVLRLRQELRGRACVVMEGEAPLEQVCAMNRLARQLGVVRGMTRVEVETFPQVAMLGRSANEEACAKAVLLECAGGFSPRVEECSEAGIFLCVLDIAGTERLCGSPETLAYRLVAQLDGLGITACVAAAGNYHAAEVASKALRAQSPVQVIPGGDEMRWLAPLPVGVLGLTAEQAETFSLWGIRTLGALADLPEKELISRMGQAGKRLRQLARGECSHLFRPVEPAFALTERMELDSPVESLETLLFVVNMLLEQLIARATARVLALASVIITLTLEGGSEHTRTVRPALPTNDRQMWLKLLHLDLEDNSPQAAVMAVGLGAEPGRPSKVQLGLFSPQLPEAARLDVTLARVRAIVGEGNVGRAILQDSHRPGAFSMEPFAVSPGAPESFSGATERPALRQLRPAETIFTALENSEPKSFIFREQRYTVERAYGPWLSSGEWWNPTLWTWEQWDVVAYAQAGSMVCCCIVRDTLRELWQMVALYD